MIGKNEKAIRDGLKDRPAFRRRNLSREAQITFDGLFNGALSKGSFNKNGALFIGKAECEWHWPDAYNELRDTGLLEYRTYEVDNHSDIGGQTTFLDWRITELGWEVRQDDLAYFNESLEAMEQDEK